MIQIHPSQKSKLKRVTFKTLIFWNICTNIPVTSPSEHLNTHVLRSWHPHRHHLTLCAVAAAQVRGHPVPRAQTLEPIRCSRRCGREGVGPEGKGRETPGECGGGGRGDATRVGRGLSGTLGKGSGGRERRGRALRLGRRRTRAAVRASDARERGTAQGQPDWGSWRRQLLKHARQLRFGVLGSNAPAGRWARRENVSSPGCVWRWHW